MSAGPKRTFEPHDRMTRLCSAMTDTLEAHEEYAEGVRAVVFIRDAKEGGIVLHAYDNDADAIADVLIHLKAVLESNGTEMRVIVDGDEL